MALDNLLRSGRIRREAVSAAEIRQALRLAARAFMFARGYRPASAEGHKNTFAFLGAALGEEHADLVSYFDRMRNKRNQAMYGMAGRIAETGARNLLTKATEFVRMIHRLVKEAS